MGAIDFTPDPSLFPFESRWLDAPVGRVHYVDEGAGRPILFLHGNPTWSFLYRGIVTRLRDRFRCVAVDYPGFGLSVRPAGYGYTPAEHAAVVGELVDALALEDLVVMGQDWGGPIGLAAAVERADRVTGLLPWGMRDFEFPPDSTLPRWRATFPDARLVPLPDAKHFIQEDAPAEIADAIAERFAG